MITNMLCFITTTVLFYCTFTAAYNFYPCPIVKPVYIVCIRHVAVDAECSHSKVHKTLSLGIFEQDYVLCIYTCNV